MWPTSSFWLEYRDQREAYAVRVVPFLRRSLQGA